MTSVTFGDPRQPKVITFSAGRFQGTGMKRQRRFKAPRQRKRFRTRGTFTAPRRRRAANLRIAGFLGIENKFFDTAATSLALVSPVDAAGGEVNPELPNTAVTFNSPAQGEGEQDRDGRQITMNSLTIRGILDIGTQANVTATDTVPSVLIALILDTQTNAVKLNSEDVYKNTGSTAPLAASVLRNLQNSKRFRVLRKIMIQPATAPQVTYDGTNIEVTGVHTPWEMHIDLKSMKTNFKSGGTTADVANIMDNSIQLVAFCTSTSYIPKLSYNARLRFMG